MKLPLLRLCESRGSLYYVLAVYLYTEALGAGLAVCLHCPIPIPVPIKNGLYKGVWRCFHCSYSDACTNTDANGYCTQFGTDKAEFNCFSFGTSVSLLK